MKRLTVLAVAVGLTAIAFAANKTKGDPAKGKAVFEAQNCGNCHSLGPDKKMGPGLKGLSARAKMNNGKKPTDVNLLAKINEGGNGMPAFADLISADEKADLIAFLKTL